MQKITVTFEIDGQIVSPPVNWQEIQILSKYDDDNIQATLDIDSFRFVNDTADFIKQAVDAGINGTGAGIFQGLPFKITLSNGVLTHEFNGYLDLTTNQIITSGIKKFASAPSTGFQTLSGSGTVTFSLTGGKDILLSNSGITGVTLPTPTTDSLGQVFTLIRNGIAPTGSYAIGTQNTADRIVIDSVVIASYQTAFSQSSITVTALATSGTCWILSNYNNVNGLILSKYIYPLSWAGTFPSNSNFTIICCIC